MTLFFKIVAVVYGVLCLFSATLQYNDPDPLLWMVIYGIAAILSFAYMFKKLSFVLYMVLAIGCGLGFFYILPEKFEGFSIGAGDIKNIEEGREAFGLLIMAMVFGLLSFGVKKNLR